MTAETNYAVPTGEFITEWLEENDVTTSTLAFKLGVSESYVHKLLAGEIAVSDALASALATLTGIPLKSWQAWESVYQKDKMRLAGWPDRVIDGVAAAKDGTFKGVRADYLLEDEVAGADEGLLERLADER